MKVLSITTSNNLIQNRKDLIKYAAEKGAGFIKDLKAQDTYNGKIVDEFMSMGFINIGSTPKEKTCSATELLKNYAKEMGLIKE